MIGARTVPTYDHRRDRATPIQLLRPARDHRARRRPAPLAGPARLHRRRTADAAALHPGRLGSVEAGPVGTLTLRRSARAPTRRPAPPPCPTAATRTGST